MNSIQNYLTTNYQMSFMARGNKAAYKFIDEAHNMTREFTRPIAEKEENRLRQYVSKFVSIFKREQKTNELNDEFCKGFIKMAQAEGLSLKAKTLLNKHCLSPGKFLEGIKTLRVIKQLQDKNTRCYLNVIEKDDPELYKACMESLARSPFEIVKEFVKDLFKKS